MCYIVITQSHADMARNRYRDSDHDDTKAEKEVRTMGKGQHTLENRKDVNFKELTEHILRSYLDSTSGEDMEILNLMDENLSVIGTGRQEFFRNLQEFSQAFASEVEQRGKVQFQWKNFQMEEQKIDEDHMLVYGSVLILGAYSSENICIRMDTRFTLLYGFMDGVWKALHIHHSVPDKEQMQNEEFPRTLGRQIDEMQDILAASRMATWNIYLIDGKAPRMEADQLMLELLGVAGRKLTPEEVYDAWFSNIVPESLPSVLESVEKMKEKGRDENTYLWKHPVLGERYVRCGGTARKVEGGVVLRGYHYDVDDMVREQKKKDKALAEQVAIINTLSRNFKNVFVANLNNGKARVVRLAEDYDVRAVMAVKGQEFSYDAVIKQWIQENVHPDDKERITSEFSYENLRRVFSEQDEYSGSYRSAEGGKLHYYQFDFRKADNSGNVVAGFQVIDSIVEEHERQAKREKELEDARLQGEREHAEVVNSLSTIYSTIFRADLDTGHYDILTSVPLMKEVAASSGDFDEVKEQIIASFIDPGFQDVMRVFLDFHTLAKRLQSENTITTEYKAPTGQWLQARFIAKRRDEEGRAKEVLYVACDITEEKLKDLKQQEELTHALAAAQQANKAKTTFLNSMSHDIRTPMNAIIGFTALAQAHMDQQAQVKDYLDKISTSSTHLLNLINDILDMSRIESGTVRLEEAAVHIPHLMDELCTMLQSLVNSRKQNLFIDIQDVVHQDVFADKLRLNQVLLNIAGNAVKFTKPGGNILIRLIEKPCSRKGYAAYEFSIKDNGIGMSKDYLGHIFETFSREYSSTVSGIQGTGLGMAITKNIVDMMGGTIQVESEEGKGSRVTVTLDLCLADESGETRIQPTARKSIVTGREQKRTYDYSGKRALLVEDNELNREIATAILEGTGMTVDSVNDGDVAVSTINGAPPDKYDLIFMDIQMPKMDGYTATREIRTLPDNRKANIPIVAMTANAFEEDKRKSYESGMNGHVIKPISLEAIAEVLDEIFPEKR